MLVDRRGSSARVGRPALAVLKEGLRDLSELCALLEKRVDKGIPGPDAMET